MNWWIDWLCVGSRSSSRRRSRRSLSCRGRRTTSGTTTPLACRRPRPRPARPAPTGAWVTPPAGRGYPHPPPPGDTSGQRRRSALGHFKTRAVYRPEILKTYAIMSPLPILLFSLYFFCSLSLENIGTQLFILPPPRPPLKYGTRYKVNATPSSRACQTKLWFGFSCKLICIQVQRNILIPKKKD